MAGPPWGQGLCLAVAWLGPVQGPGRWLRLCNIASRAREMLSFAKSYRPVYAKALLPGRPVQADFRRPRIAFEKHRVVFSFFGLLVWAVSLVTRPSATPQPLQTRETFKNSRFPATFEEKSRKTRHFSSLSPGGCGKAPVGNKPAGNKQVGRACGCCWGAGLWPVALAEPVGNKRAGNKPLGQACGPWL